MNNESCRKAINWFDEQEIKISRKNIKDISRADLINALSLSSNGFLDLLKNVNQSKTSIQFMIQKLLTLSFDEGIDFLLEYPELLKVPLILDNHKLIIGYNVDEIRTFIPKQYRKIRLS